MSTSEATAYWKGRGSYPFSFTKKRRIHELNYLLPKLEQAEGKRVLDLGCGDGSLLECLLRLTDYETFFGFDVAEDLLKGIDPRVETSVYDLAQGGALPQVDVTIIAGVIQYLFDDELVVDVLRRVTSPVVFVRSTCTLDSEQEAVHRDGYASLYRTLPQTLDLLGKVFRVSAVDRIYPDEIESPFGTKQFYFEARRY